MNTLSHLWQYLAKLFLEWEMFYTKIVEKIKTHIFWWITFFFQKSHCLWDNVEKCGGARGATSDGTIWRMHMDCRTSKATHTLACAHAPGYPHARTHRQLLFHGNSDLRTCLNVTLYVHCVLLLLPYLGCRTNQRNIPFVYLHLLVQGRRVLFCVF